MMNKKLQSCFHGESSVWISQKLCSSASQCRKPTPRSELFTGLYRKNEILDIVEQLGRCAHNKTCPLLSSSSCTMCKMCCVMHNLQQLVSSIFFILCLISLHCNIHSDYAQRDHTIHLVTSIARPSSKCLLSTMTIPSTCC